MKIYYNQFKIISLLLLMASLAPSCKKLIEIPANPPNYISSEHVFSDSADVMAAMAGLYSYSSIAPSGFGFRNGLLTVYTGLTSDELANNNSSDASISQFYSNAILPANTDLDNTWSPPYGALYQVNACIEGLKDSGAISATLRQQLLGELKVNRALYYFYLVNLFGNVPLVTATDYKITSVQPRVSVDSVYAQIIADLLDATTKLTASYPANDRARPNLYVAEALLAKVYLYRGQWQNAYDAASLVLRSGLYSLEPDLNKVFLDGSQEAIWQLPMTGSVFVSSEAQAFVPMVSFLPPSFPLSTTLTNAFETGDQRKVKWVGVSNVTMGPPQTFYYPYKYKNKFASQSQTLEDYMICRLGELYLIHAEAAAHLDDKLADALSDINIVRARAGLSGSTAATQTDVLNAIQHERQTELFCEWGNRWFDLRRTGVIDAVLGAEKTAWKSTDALFPVPQQEIRNNPHLDQNAGY